MSQTLDAWSRHRDLEDLILASGTCGHNRDFSLCTSQVLEEGRDRFNAATVALGDIRKCQDEIAWGEL